MRKKIFKSALIFFIFIIASILCAFGFYVLSLKKQLNSGESFQTFLMQLQAGKKYSLSSEGRNDYWLGSAKPKITIYEFADFNCPNSKNSFSKAREIGIKYQNQVKIVFKDFPVYDNSVNLAMAARCAGEQGLFWPMHDKLYLNQGGFDASKIDEITSLAVMAGVSQSKFKTCMEDKKYLSDIQKDYADGVEIEASGTPTWIINGYKVSGDIPYDTFMKLISEMLE